MANEVISAILFVVALIVSTVIIYIVTKLFKQKEGIGRAFVTALIGTIVYSIAAADRNWTSMMFGDIFEKASMISS